MTIRYVLGLSLLISLGCQSPANSQQASNQEVDSPGIQNISDRAQTRDRDLALAQIANSRSTAITQAVNHVSPAVVSVTLTGTERVAYRDNFMDIWSQFMGQRPRTQYADRQVNSLGSGFLISNDGYIVTNDHVIGPKRRQGVVDSDIEIIVSFSDGSKLNAELVGSDPVSDIALLKVSSEEILDYINFDTSESVLVGEWAIALGSPYGLFQASEPTVTVGVVSGYGRDFDPQDGRLYRDMIQTDAAINPGNSGGPLVNAIGDVIGVNSFIYSRAGGSDGVGFAVPAYTVTEIVTELKENGFIDRAQASDLGIQARDLSTIRNRRVFDRLKLTDTRGIIVTEVREDTPAERSGIELYDVIRAVGDQEIRSGADYQTFLSEFRHGETVPLTVIREGEERIIEVAIDNTP